MTARILCEMYYEYNRPETICRQTQVKAIDVEAQWAPKGRY